MFDGIHDLAARVDDPELDVRRDERHGPAQRGADRRPGHAGVGPSPHPGEAAARGVTDLLRISDARMSGTSYGAVVLHVTPESAVGGPLALVEDGDPIRLDVSERRLDLLVEADELERRRATWEPPARQDERGYRSLHADHVLQASEGCDFDFLRGKTGVVRDVVTYL